MKQITHKTGNLILGNIDNNQYTVSLLKEGLRTGYINKAEVLKIQEDILMILKDLIMRYTNGASTSVTVDTAERLLNSVYYAIDASVKSYNNPEEGIRILTSKKANEIYQCGIEILTECVNQTKALYNNMLNDKLDIDNDVYNDTIDKALSSFFYNYSVVFSAHDIVADIDIDYPLVFDDMSIKGVYYIKQYIEKLNVENRFCRNYAPHDVSNIFINGGSRLFGVDCRQFPLNIFEIIFNNSVFTILAGNNGDKISISDYECGIIKQNLMMMDECRIKRTVKKAVEDIINYFSITDNDTIDYIYKYSTLLSGRIINSLESNGLDKMIVTDAKEAQGIKDIKFEDGVRIGDKKFRAIVKSVESCKSPCDKIRIITSEIHSSSDLIDILDSECLNEEEYLLLFSSLDNLELSILVKYLFNDELRDNLWNLKALVENKGKIDVDKEWHISYLNFLCNCGRDKFDDIERNIYSMGA